VFTYLTHIGRKFLSINTCDGNQTGTENVTRHFRHTKLESRCRALPTDIHDQQTGTAKTFTAAGQLSFIISLRNGNMTVVITLQIIQCIIYYTPFPFWIEDTHSSFSKVNTSDLIINSVICTCILLLSIKSTQIPSAVCKHSSYAHKNTLAQST
jgi:uncharacterized CHY-type Zn-finger protein